MPVVSKAHLKWTMSSLWKQQDDALAFNLYFLRPNESFWPDVLPVKWQGNIWHRLIKYETRSETFGIASLMM